MVLVYDEYRRRLLHPNKSFGPRRWSPKDIHLVSTDAYEQYLTFSKYDRDANDWIEMRKESSGGPNGNMVVVNDKLYVLGGTDSNGVIHIPYYLLMTSCSLSFMCFVSFHSMRKAQFVRFNRKISPESNFPI